MPDLDQGGTFTTKNKVYMGPSIGWIEQPASIVRVTAGGTTVISIGASVVTVAFNGAVTIQLPQYKGSTVGAGVLPGQFVPATITIIDTGQFATNHPITILPGAGELISGNANYQITSNGGAVVLQPDPINGGSTVVV